MNEEHFPVFKLYINKEHKDISVKRDGEMFFVFNYYTDTVDHRIPHVLHKALTDKLIVTATGFNLIDVYMQCKKYFVRITNDFPSLYNNVTARYTFSPEFLMIYDLFYCNIIVNNMYILPATFVNDGINKLAFNVILEDLDRHVAECKYGIEFPKYFRMDIWLDNKVWYEKIYC